MDVTVVLDGRFRQAQDGSVWSGSAFPYAFWQRYLEIFDGVRVAARLGQGDPSAADVRSDGPRVSFSPVPYFVGPWQYLWQRRATRAAMSAAVSHPGAVIMRVGSELANLAWPFLMDRRQPYGLEIVGDPWDVFARGVIRHPLRPFLRRYFRWQLVRQCRQAAAVAYVTEFALQRRYPVGRGHATAYSSMSLRLQGGLQTETPEFFVSDVVVPEANPDRCSRVDRNGRYRLVFVGSLEQLYKGPDVLLRAFALCRNQGLEATLRIVGDGRCRSGLTELAARLGQGEAIEFVGALPPGEAVFRELAQADLFVLPSRTEGLPRALIEAMASGLPCLATGVGGIPELLAPEDLVAPGDVRGLARQITAVMEDPGRRMRMRERNLCRAADFTEPVLAPRRRAFYTYVHNVTDEWLRTTPPLQGQ